VVHRNKYISILKINIKMTNISIANQIVTPHHRKTKYK